MSRIGAAARRACRGWRLPRRDEAGASALIIALMVPTVFLGCAAIGVDTAQWYLERQRVQKAADAAALAGVPFLPQNFDAAKARALEVSARNGYDDASPNVEVIVELGELASELDVTVRSRVVNSFGAALGVRSAELEASASADYQGPAPMGSPCNTFGNEPRAGDGASSPTPAGTARGASPPANCSATPQLWAAVTGPQVDKANGDRYQARSCGSSTYGCSGGKNSEFDPNGYFFLVKVQAAAVGKPISLQLYDPAYVETGSTCGQLSSSSAFKDSWGNPILNWNPYVKTDAATRYAKTGEAFCNGDRGYIALSQSNREHSESLMTTSFALREQVDSQNPKAAPVIDGCVKQYTGTTTAPSANTLRSGQSAYNKHLAQVFHNWTSLCTFTPAREGDYYLQVQTDVKPGGTAEDNGGKTAIVYSGNSAVGDSSRATYTEGDGLNSFAMRAVPPAGLENAVSVSGYDRMPIFANADSATSTFNLIRVLPGAAGQYVSFSFFDVGDVSGTNGGTVKVSRPSDATGSILTTPFPGGCRSQGGYAGTTEVTLTNCSAPVNQTRNNAAVQTITIPIPADYSCNYAAMSGCWYQVTVSFPGTSVNDFTTWDASVVGDPVRLID